MVGWLGIEYSVGCHDARLVLALWNGRREYPRGLPDGSPRDDRLPLFQIYEYRLCHDRRPSEDAAEGW
jgi:hypothetical protein